VLAANSPHLSVLDELGDHLSVIFGALVACVVVVLLTPAVGGMARRLGVVDVPGGRRVNQLPVPRLGGLALFLGLLVPALAFLPAMAGGTFLLAGACADILLIATYQLVDAAVPDSRRAEAGAWVNTAYNLGAAMGTAAGGVLAAGLGPRVSLAVMAALTGACALVTAGAGGGSIPMFRGPGMVARRRR